MTLPLSRSLGARIFALAIINLALLIAIALFALGVRLPRNAGELMLQTSAERIGNVTRQLTLDIESTPRSEADALLGRYETRYGSRFLLVTNDGGRIAGAGLEIPPQMLAWLAGRLRPDGTEASPLRPPPPFDSRDPGLVQGKPFDSRDFPLAQGKPGRGPGPGAGGPRPPGGRGPGTEPRPYITRVDGELAYWVGSRLPIRFADAQEVIPGSLLMASRSAYGNALLFPWQWIAWGAAALAVTALCWWPLLAGVTRSLRRMEDATARIAEGQFETALRIRRRDEIGRLASSIEQMAARLEVLVSGQKRFLGDTAHELRSPLGRMQVALELLNTRSAAAERTYVADLRDDVAEMTRLTDDLLQFARAELADRDAPLEPTLVADAVRRAVRLEGRPTADIRVHVPNGVTVVAQRDAVFRSVANVLRNAVRYAGDAGPITIDASTSGDTVDIAITDRGPGVPVESLARVFEPFFRVDVARDRRTGGTGLGLAIVKSAVEASGGRVSCRNREPGFEVRLSWRAAAVQSSKFKVQS